MLAILAVLESCGGDGEGSLSSSGGRLGMRVLGTSAGQTAVGGTTATGGGTAEVVGGASQGGTTSTSIASTAGNPATIGGTTATGTTGGSNGLAGSSSSGGAAAVGGTTSSQGGVTSGGTANVASDAGVGGTSSVEVPILQACSNVCADQIHLDCLADTCVDDCVNYLNPPGPLPAVAAQYTDYLGCVQDKLTMNEVVCAASGSHFNWSLRPGTACETSLCKWSCSDQASADANVVARCNC